MRWSAFPQGSAYFVPSTRAFMIDFTVDDQDAALDRLTAKGVVVLKHDKRDLNGDFAWILYPDDTKIEVSLRREPPFLMRA